MARGLITLARIPQVERAGQQLEGQIADAAAAIAKARQAKQRITTTVNGEVVQISYIVGPLVQSFDRSFRQR